MAHQSSVMQASITRLSPGPVVTEAHHDKPEEHPEDRTPSDTQPPGVDEDYESLEEALTGD